MNQNLIVKTFSLSDPDSTAGLTTGAAYFMMPITATLIYVSVSPFEDDTGARVTINDDGTAIVSDVDAADHDVPGEWSTTHTGGTNTPQQIAAGSEMSIDIIAGAAGNRFDIELYFLTGAGWG